MDDLKRRDEPSTNANQRFFVGGEKSGMYVEGGEDDDGLAADEFTRRAVQSVFGKAKLPEDDDKPKPFQGRPHRLDDPDNGKDQLNKDAKDKDKEPEIPVKRYVIFWRDGITIEDGPLKPYSDPNTHKLLEQLNSNQAPLREFNLQPGQMVDIKCAHCLEENYSESLLKAELAEMRGDAGKEEKKPVFVGSSYKLTDLTDIKPIKMQVELEEGAVLPFDPNKPSTKLQLRLSNGQKYILVFNNCTCVELWKM